MLEKRFRMILYETQCFDFFYILLVIIVIGDLSFLFHCLLWRRLLQTTMNGYFFFILTTSDGFMKIAKHFNNNSDPIINFSNSVFSKNSNIICPSAISDCLLNLVTQCANQKYSKRSSKKVLEDIHFVLLQDMQLRCFTLLNALIKLHS